MMKSLSVIMNKNNEGRKKKTQKTVLGKGMIKICFVLFFYVVHYLCLLSMKCPKKTCVQLYIRVCVSSFFYIGEMGRKKDKLVEKNFDF